VTPEREWEENERMVGRGRNLSERDLETQKPSVMLQVAAA